jgi:DNA (cytosine-5)-methyltransferase 1
MAKGLTFLDFFAGIGGFRLGMEMAGHRCLGHCEIDKYAHKSYVAMHSPREDEWYADDIRAVQPRELPTADVYTFGFPCQSFSIAGKRGGFEDTRGTLFFEVMRLAKERQPKYLFAENVAGLLSHDGGRTFATILNSLTDNGYEFQWQVLNSKNFGVPQNRERVFIIGHLRGTSRPEIFPIRNADGETLRQIIGGSQGYRVYDPNGISATLASEAGGMGAKTGLYFINRPKFDQIEKSNVCQTLRVGSDVPLVSAVLTPNREEKRQNGRRMKEPGEPMFTLTAQDIHGIYIPEATKQGYAVAHEGDSINLAVPGSETRRGRVGVANALDTSCNQGTLAGGRIRKLTPLECFRLQGFPDEYFYRAQAVNSDSQLYKQAGNSVTVNVIYVIAQRLGTGVM